MDNPTSSFAPDTFRAAIGRLHEAAAQRASRLASEQENDQGLWQIALALMVVGLVAEGALGRRLG
jgi:hypothetical protein